MKKVFNFLLNNSLSILALLAGAATGVVMAAAPNVPLEGGGVSVSGSQAGDSAGKGTLGGISTETVGRELTSDNPGFYLSEVDSRIVKIRPMATPVDQISRYAKSISSKSFEVKYYSVGTRPLATTLNSGVTATANTTVLDVDSDDAGMFTLDDTIRVKGVKGYVIGTDTPSDQDLVLCVCGRDNTTSRPIVYAVNGLLSNGQNTKIPAISTGTTLIRMGKACGELDVQTGRFHAIPTPNIQYCQNFMIQVEQSTFEKIAAKEVDWGFSDIEEDGILDMKIAQENTFLFGVKNVIKHVTKDGMATWFTEGIWWQAGSEQTLGHWDAQAGEAVVSDDDLVDFSKAVFTGPGAGNKTKILLCGSESLAALSKIKSEKFRLKDNVESWGLKFKSWDTEFGEILTMHHELFDLNGMSNQAFLLDPEYLVKCVHLPWERNVLDLKSAGVRNADAVVLQEVACLYLRHPQAHARVTLATA